MMTVMLVLFFIISLCAGYEFSQARSRQDRHLQVRMLFAEAAEKIIRNQYSSAVNVLEAVRRIDKRSVSEQLFLELLVMADRGDESAAMKNYFDEKIKRELMMWRQNGTLPCEVEKFVRNHSKIKWGKGRFSTLACLFFGEE